MPLRVCIQPVNIPAVGSQSNTRLVIPSIGKPVLQALVERALKHKSHRVGRHGLKPDTRPQCAHQHDRHVLLGEEGKVQVDIMLDRVEMLASFILMVPGVEMARPEVDERQHCSVGYTGKEEQDLLMSHRLPQLSANLLDLVTWHILKDEPQKVLADRDELQLFNIASPAVITLKDL